MSRYVYLLGAGASRSEGAPVQKDLFKEYFKLFQQKRIPEHISKKINTFFREFYGISTDKQKIDSISFPTFEEVMGVLEIADNREEFFRDHVRTKKSLSLLKNYFIYLIAIVLTEKLSHRYYDYYHYNLLKRLQKDDTLWDSLFISLNYDIIIDNSISKGLESEINYGCTFFNYADRNYGLKLFKLHGSLNWLYCPYCNSLLLSEGIKIVTKIIYDPNIRCDKCNSKNLQPVIVPPTYFKAMSNYYIQQIWHNIDLALQNSSKLFICGYSFPEADIHIRYLLKRAEMYMRNRGLEVFIINGRKSEENSEIQRFYKFFKNKGKINNTNLSFEEFSRKGV